MDITPGEFKDLYEYTSGRSSRNSQNQSRLSSRGSLCSSMEILPPEQNNTPRNKGRDSAAFEKKSDPDNSMSNALSLTNVSILNSLNKSANKSMKTLSSSLSDHSLASSTSDTDTIELSNVNHEDKDSARFESMKSHEELAMEKAIKKMQKLDKVLMGKMKHEREIKRQRLMLQKSFYSDLEKLKSESKNGTYTEITNNTSKYLALLPPSQQLDVLLEQHQKVEDFEPIFQTQIYSNHSFPPFEQSKARTDSRRDRSTVEGDKQDDVKSERENTSDMSSNNPKEKRSNKESDYKTNFIERNIQLAKDAGSMIAMTEEEKSRLEMLLEEGDGAEENEADHAFHLIASHHGEGYTPDRSEITHLRAIDERLQALLSPAVYSSISSTSLMNRSFQNTTNEMIDVGRKMAKSSVTETLTPEQRISEIEERLSQLNDGWKNAFNFDRPRLSEHQLHRLLDECSRPTSPESITTSSLSKLDFRDHVDRSSPASFVSSESDLPSTLNSSLASESRCSSRSSEATLTSEPESSRSRAPVLEKHVLEDLLREAKQSLGIGVEDEESEDEDDFGDP